MARFITFASGKGGVGKTTLTANLGAALHKYGKDVIVVDGNLSTPNISVLLGMPKLPQTLHDVLSGKTKTKDAVYLHPSGLKVLPSALSMTHMKLKQKKHLATALNDLVGKAEFVLIDCAAGLGNEALQALQAGDELVIVTNPEIHSLTDALKTYEYAKELGLMPLGVILNRSAGKDWEMTKENVEDFLELPVIATIPEDENIKRAISLKQPIVYSFPKSPASRAIKRFAASLVGEDYRIFEPETFGERLLRFFKIV